MDLRQAHQKLKEELRLDHFEARSWQGLHRHALMTMIAYAFLQHRRLAQAGRKNESTDRRRSQVCRRYAKPSSISSFDRQLSDAHTAENESVKSCNPICQSSAKTSSRVRPAELRAPGASVPIVGSTRYVKHLAPRNLIPISEPHRERVRVRAAQDGADQGLAPTTARKNDFQVGRQRSGGG